MNVEGKVLQIIDRYRIVIDLGAEDVGKGDRLLVYSLGDEIMNEGVSLGRLEIAKAEVVVEHTQPRFSTCVSPGKTETITEMIPDPNSPFYAIQRISSLYGGQTIPTVRTRESRMPLPLAEIPEGIDRKIRVGDLVRKL